MPIAIRSLLPGDGPALAAIVDATPLWQRYGLPGARAAESLSAATGKGEQVVVAVDGSEVVGFAWWMPRGTFGRSPYLRLIGVRPELRSRSTGAALLEAFEQDARGTAKDCFLLVSDFNVEARRFYERHGYQQVGAIPGFVLPDVTELLYRKVLA